MSRDRRVRVPMFGCSDVRSMRGHSSIAGVSTMMMVKVSSLSLMSSSFVAHFSRQRSVLPRSFTHRHRHRRQATCHGRRAQPRASRRLETREQIRIPRIALQGAAEGQGGIAAAESRATRRRQNPGQSKNWPADRAGHLCGGRLAPNRQNRLLGSSERRASALRWPRPRVVDQCRGASSLPSSARR